MKIVTFWVNRVAITHRNLKIPTVSGNQMRVEIKFGRMIQNSDGTTTYFFSKTGKNGIVHNEKEKTIALN